jgi:hypothetical protein
MLIGEQPQFDSYHSAGGALAKLRWQRRLRIKIQNSWVQTFGLHLGYQSDLRHAHAKHFEPLRKAGVVFGGNYNGNMPYKVKAAQASAFLSLLFVLTPSQDRLNIDQKRWAGEQTLPELLAVEEQRLRQPGLAREGTGRTMKGRAKGSLLGQRVLQRR